MQLMHKLHSLVTTSNPQNFLHWFYCSQYCMGSNLWGSNFHGFCVSYPEKLQNFIYILLKYVINYAMKI